MRHPMTCCQCTATVLRCSSFGGDVTRASKGKAYVCWPVCRHCRRKCVLLSGCSSSEQAASMIPASSYARLEPSHVAVSGARQHLYVANASTITVYDLSRASPLRTISNASPMAIAFGQQGEIYVASAVGGKQGSVSAYAPGASLPSYFESSTGSISLTPLQSMEAGISS
jgi:hypothetical protein